MPVDLIKDGRLDREAAAVALRQFLEATVRAAGFQLKVTVQTIAPETGGGREEEVVADLDGRDKELLLERGAEVLKALEHLAHRALRLEPAFHEKIRLDCGGYRAVRFEELRMTARVAAERVQSSKQPFRLNPMSSRERRIVHMALKEMPGVRTESVGAGEERQVVIHPAGDGAGTAARAHAPGRRAYQPLGKRYRSGASPLRVRRAGLRQAAERNVRFCHLRSSLWHAESLCRPGPLWSETVLLRVSRRTAGFRL